MDIFIDKKINILEKVKGILTGGHIVALYRECDSLYAENLLKELVRDYRISKKVFPSNSENTHDMVVDAMELQDDVRLMIVFGGANIIEIAKDASTMLGIPLIIVLTKATKVDANKSYIFSNEELEIRRAVSPKLIMADSEFIKDKSGYTSIIGDFACQLLYSVDDVFTSIARGNGVSIDNVSKLLAMASNFSEDSKIDILKASYQCESSRDIVRRIKEILSHNNSSHIDADNIEFVIAYMILSLYKGFINISHDDIIYPPDIMESVKRLHSRFNMDTSSMMLNFKMISSSEYMRKIHVIEEYRYELLSIIDKALATISKLSKVFRRVAKDAGYEMFDGVSTDDLMENISLLSTLDYSESILKLMKVGGYLERYIDMRQN